MKMSLALSLLVVSLGCGASHHGGGSTGPRSFALVSPTNLSGFPGASGPVTLSATVNGAPSNGDTLTITAGTGVSVSPSTVVTSSGNATVSLAFPSPAGTGTLTISMLGANGSGVITLRSVAPTGATLTLATASGDGQTAMNGSLPQPLVVKLTDPQNGNAPFVGAVVTFTSPANPTPASDTTDDQGLAGIQISGITNPPGTYSVQAQAANGGVPVSNAVNFTFTVP